MSGSDVSSSARVVVGVSGSLGSLTALRRAAGEARRRGAELWPVLVWQPPGGNLAARRSPAASSTVDGWEHLARQRLLTVLGEVFGSTWDVPLRAHVARGVTGPVLVGIADRDDDVLVIGAGQRGWLHRALVPSVSRYCLAHARCPVLMVPPSPLQAELARARRRNAWRLRLDTGHFAQRSAAVPPDA